MKLKYNWLLILFLGLVACNVDNNLDPIPEVITPIIKINTGTANFSNYVAIGASFTAGFTDGALFKKGQENSFPNILSKKIKMIKGNEKSAFTQPLINDNIGGLLLGGKVISNPRFYFNGKTPILLNVTPTTKLSPQTNTFNNMGVPGLKSFHLAFKGYGNIVGVTLKKANSYFVRMASTPNASVLEDVLSQKPTFFTLSEIGGNDVLSYATNGGEGVYQKGNLNPKTYGYNDITDPTVFKASFSKTVDALIKGGAKEGVVTNVPYITSLPFFTTIPYNSLNTKTNKILAAQVPLLNKIYGELNKIFTAIGQKKRIVIFKKDQANPIVIKDESLTNLAPQIKKALLANRVAFNTFISQFGLPATIAPIVANLLAVTYGQSRPATKNDLFVLTSSSVIGTINKTSVANLMKGGLSQALAGQFSVEGVTLPLEDKWALIPKEQAEIKEATDAYNTTIKMVADTKKLAFVDFKTILNTATTAGIPFDNYTLTTKLVTGGLVSLDGVHLTARGYALMANKFLEAIDTTYGSNFGKATNGLVKADNYPTNYSKDLR